jgi:hypothetical protein
MLSRPGVTYSSTFSLNKMTVNREIIKSNEDEGLLQPNRNLGNNITTSSPDLYLSKVNDMTTAVERRGKISVIMNETKTILLSTMDKSLLHNWNFLLFCASHFILFMWIGIPYVYLVDKSILIGITKARAAFLLSIIGISRTAGQLILGFLGDLPQINTLGLYAGSIIMCGIVTITVPVCTEYISLSFYAVIFGFAVSATYALQMICIVNIVGLERSTSAFGLLQLAMGIATLLGTPISGIFNLILSLLQYCASASNGVNMKTEPSSLESVWCWCLLLFAVCY